MSTAIYSSRNVTYSAEDIGAQTYVTLWGGSTSRDPYTTFLELGIRVAQYLRAVERMTVSVTEVFPSKAKDLPWTWDDEERNIRTRQCLCCGRAGHYQKMLEAHMAVHGTDCLGIVVDDEGYVSDGHHRVVAALHLGIDQLPVESPEGAQARWVRDHGYVDWHHRKFGDR